MGPTKERPCAHPSSRSFGGGRRSRRRVGGDGGGGPRAHRGRHAEDDRRRQHVRGARGMVDACADPPPSSRRPRADRSSCSSMCREGRRDTPTPRWPPRGRRTSRTRSGRSRSRRRSPTRTAGPSARRYAYQTSPNEKRDVGADVRRANDVWTVAIYDVAQAVGEKRGAQVGLIYGKLLPKGRTPRILRRQEGEHARRGAPGRAQEVRRDVDEAHAACRASRSASTRTAAWCSRTASACASSASRRKVDADTRYMIASNTKAMATLMLAKLVEQKKLALGHAGGEGRCRRSSSATPKSRARC